MKRAIEIRGMQALVFLILLASFVKTQEAPQCSIDCVSSSSFESLRKGVDPNLHEMTYDVGDGEQMTMVYIEPPISTFYHDHPPSQKKVNPKFNGLSGKFINMSNKPISLYWEDYVGGTRYPQRHLNPFSATGSGTYPTHRFLFTELENPDEVLKICIVQNYPENIYYYDPFVVEGDEAATERNLATMNSKDRELYNGLVKTLKFNNQYKAKTGRSYLANYLRDPPIHFMWPADYFGQEHWVTTKETHFVQHPPTKLLNPINAQGTHHHLNSDDERRALSKYRAADPMMNITLKVISVAPRVFEIPSFLSEVEVAHILHIATGMKLSISDTGESEVGEKKVRRDNTRTRTSYNTWVHRDKSPIIDVIYRRAANAMRIDESLLRERNLDERPDIQNRQSMAEELQLVHYGLSQEYTAHHDFGYTNIADKKQGARFATLLLYLNEGMTGGETSFPRWVNAETFKELKVTPKIGKAVLFYSQLPDGNLDDFSQHSALPVTDGEKWLINLWVHSPMREKS